MEGPSMKILTELVNKIKRENRSEQFATHADKYTFNHAIPNYLMETKYSSNPKSVTKKNASSSISSLAIGEKLQNFTNQLEIIDEYCILESTITKRKNDIIPALSNNERSESEPHKFATKVQHTKPRRNIVTEIQPDFIESEYEIKSKITDHTDKSTYCRPVVNKYTQEFVQQTMAKNARLQDLVKRLVLARQAEKQNDSWNKYINELKTKHERFHQSTSYVDDLVMDNKIIKLVEDFNNSRRSDNLCEDNRNDHIVNSDVTPKDGVLPSNNGPGNNKTPFPSSSQACISILSQGRCSNQRTKDCRRCLTNRCVNCCNALSNSVSIASGPRKLCNCGEKIILKSTYIQTDPATSRNSIISNNNSIKSENVSETVKRKSIDSTTPIHDNNGKQSNDNIIQYHDDKIKGNIRETRTNTKLASLATIEYKLDNLIESINKFMLEVRAKKGNGKSLRSVAVSISIENVHKMTENDKYDSSGVKSDDRGHDASFTLRKEILCGVSNTNLAYSAKPNSTIDDILLEERNKSDKVKKDIEEILSKNDRHCAVQFTFDIPTKEGATEVTESFYDTLDTLMDSVDDCGTKRMTMAVNTDPMGFLALLRLSTEALKQMLSSVPSIDYLAYLARIQQAGIQSANDMQPLFQCNICGASFRQPSQLSDHINGHNLGSSRNCCVCRHEVGVARHHPGLFRCRHCGQVFTRAYCRQLHEQGCAKNADVRNSEGTPTGLLLLS